MIEFEIFIMDKQVFVCIIIFGVAFGSNEQKLYNAAKEGDLSTLTDLLKSRVNPTWRNTDRSTALHAAADNNHAAAVEALLKAGADKDMQDELGMTPLWLAAWRGNTAAVEILLKYGADVNIPRHRSGKTPLMVAIDHGYINIVRALINSPQGNLDYQDKNRALHQSVNGKQDNIVELLVYNGGDVNIPAHDGRTPLMMAIDSGYTNIAETLITAPQAYLDFQDRQGRTALYYAVIKNMDGIVDILLQSGADVDIPDDVSGITPLMVAIEHENVKIAKALINAKANLDHLDTQGQTALHSAVSKNLEGMVELLLWNGANQTIQYNGMTPVDIVRIRGYHQLENIINRVQRDITRVEL